MLTREAKTCLRRVPIFLLALAWFSPAAGATSASRSFPMICSGENRFLLISCFPLIHHSNLTCGSVLGGQVINKRAFFENWFLLIPCTLKLLLRNALLKP
jgi:hypothetical protein